jgi:hypothetical protein
MGFNRGFTPLKRCVVAALFSLAACNSKAKPQLSLEDLAQPFAGDSAARFRDAIYRFEITGAAAFMESHQFYDPEQDALSMPFTMGPTTYTMSLGPARTLYEGLAQTDPSLAQVFATLPHDDSITYIIQVENQGQQHMYIDRKHDGVLDAASIQTNGYTYTLQADPHMEPVFRKTFWRATLNAELYLSNVMKHGATVRISEPVATNENVMS